MREGKCLLWWWTCFALVARWFWSESRFSTEGHITLFVTQSTEREQYVPYFSIPEDPFNKHTSITIIKMDTQPLLWGASPSLWPSQGVLFQKLHTAASCTLFTILRCIVSVLGVTEHFSWQPCSSCQGWQTSSRFNMLPLVVREYLLYHLSIWRKFVDDHQEVSDSCWCTKLTLSYVIVSHTGSHQGLYFTPAPEVGRQ